MPFFSKIKCTANKQLNMLVVILITSKCFFVNENLGNMFLIIAISCTYLPFYGTQQLFSYPGTQS